MLSLSSLWLLQEKLQLTCRKLHNTSPKRYQTRNFHCVLPIWSGHITSWGLRWGVIHKGLSIKKLIWPW
jgi:hypothetical protein